MEEEPIIVEDEAQTVVSAPSRPTPRAYDVIADLSYVLPGEGIPVSYTYEPPAGVPWESGQFLDLPVRIADARAMPSAPRLDIHGFELVQERSVVRNFDDRDEVQDVYYPEVRHLALRMTGGIEAVVFDHLVRRFDPRQRAPSFGRKVKGQPPSANGRVHNDYTEASGQRRLRMVLGEGRRADAVRRYCIVNVWRPLRHPVFDAPLALCDARSVSFDDGVVSEVRYPARIGEIYLFRHSRRHAWYYFPRMTPDEAVVFKQYDSKRSGTSRFTPHSAFVHRQVAPGTPPRESIEARVLVVLE